MEGLAGRARVHTAPPVEGEQRAVGPGGSVLLMPVLELAVQQFTDLWAVRDEAGLAELATADHEQTAVDIDVCDPQSACLARS